MHRVATLENDSFVHTAYNASCIAKRHSGEITMTMTVMIGCMALMVGGRPIDMECGVCFGIIGVRIVTDAVEPAETVPQSNGSQERDVPRQLHAALGPPFSV